MRASTFVLVAIICSGVIAADTVDCTVFKNNLTCIDPACQFTANGNDNSCDSKCFTLTANKDDCNKNTICQFNDAVCATKATTCNQVQGDVTQANCSAQNADCIFTNTKPATCGVSKTISDACAAKNDDQPGCSTTDNCTFTEKTQVCNFNQAAVTCSPTQCSTNYCNGTYTCSLTTPDACSKLGAADTCGANAACSWDDKNNQCNDVCSTKLQGDCTGDCAVSFPDCALNADKGATFCSANKNDKDCSAVLPANVCQIASTGTCGVNNDVTTACQNVAVCDAQTCTKVDEVKATCVNPTCTQDLKNCGQGCNATEAVCAAKDTTACGKNTTQGDCNATATFCQYVMNGKCAAKDSGDTNAALLTFAFLSTLFALLF